MMMSSLARPTMRRYPSSISPMSPVRNQPSSKARPRDLGEVAVAGEDARPPHPDLTCLRVKTELDARKGKPTVPARRSPSQWIRDGEQRLGHAVALEYHLSATLLDSSV